MCVGVLAARPTHIKTRTPTRSDATQLACLRLPRHSPLPTFNAPPPHTQAAVDAYHAAFYASIADLWARHRHRHPVLCRAELVFEWGRHGPPPGWK
jgi:hypothetical protein